MATARIVALTPLHLRDLLRHLRGKVIVVWDGGPNHKGEAVRAFLARNPRLRVERLPAYAPDLNPVEAVWSWLKYGKLANFVPRDVSHLDDLVLEHLIALKCDPGLLRRLWDGSDLPFPSCNVKHPEQEAAGEARREAEAEVYPGRRGSEPRRAARATETPAIRRDDQEGDHQAPHGLELGEAESRTGSNCRVDSNIRAETYESCGEELIAADRVSYGLSRSTLSRRRPAPLEDRPMPSPLTNDLLDVLDTLAGGVHPGFRPAHAKGTMYAGTFTPSPAAAGLTRAPHATRASTPVTVRFSPSAGIPTVADNDPKGSSPQGMAVRFHLADHIHTDIVAHSYNGFPARTGEEFLAFLRAVAASGPGVPTPPPVVGFLADHPAARAFAEAAKPIPTSFARQAFFAITAFKFTNTAGASRFGRFRLRPEAGTEFLSAEEAKKKTADFLAAELSARLSAGPVRFQVAVQLAGVGDPVEDATAVWPDDRTEVEFGTLAITERADELMPEMRKVIFDPVPRVDGIEPAGDPLTEVRSDIYLASGRRRRAAATQ